MLLSSCVLQCNEQRLQMSESGQDQCAEQVTALEARIKELEDILCQKEHTVQDLSVTLHFSSLYIILLVLFYLPLIWVLIEFMC